MKRLLQVFVLVLLGTTVLARDVVGPVVRIPFSGGGGGSATAAGSTIAGCTAYSLVFIDSAGALKCDLTPINGNSTTVGRSIFTVRDSITGASATSNFLSVVGAFPATLTAETTGALFSITYDNDAQTQSALKVLGSGTADANSNVVLIDNGASIARPLVINDNGSAVVTIADGGATTFASGANILVTGAANFTAPQIATASAATTGFGYSTSDTNWYFAAAGTGIIEIGSAAGGQGITLDRDPICASIACGFNFSAGPGNAVDARLTSEAAAIFQLGADVNGAAVNQTLKAHDGITGTDVLGAGLRLFPGLGTGLGVSNPLTLNRVVTRATGTTAQTYSPSFVACPTKILSNTSATVQTIATITTTSTTGGGVTVDYSTVANNGTLQNTDGGMVKVSWNNNAGTVAAAMTAVALQSDSDASGTLATTPTATVATNVVSIRFTPTWATIVPTTVTGWATFTLHTSGDTVVCQ